MSHPLKLSNINKRPGEIFILASLIGFCLEKILSQYDVSGGARLFLVTGRVSFESEHSFTSDTIEQDFSRCTRKSESSRCHSSRPLSGAVLLSLHREIASTRI